jgi:hypothetical protein
MNTSLARARTRRRYFVTVMLGTGYVMLRPLQVRGGPHELSSPLQNGTETHRPPPHCGPCTATSSPPPLPGLLQGMMKRPVTAVFGIVAIVALAYGTRVALEFMLGVNEYE